MRGHVFDLPADKRARWVTALPRHSIAPLTAPVVNYNALEDIDMSTRLVMEVLGVDGIIQLFLCVLLERKLLLVSSRYSVLTATAVLLASGTPAGGSCAVGAATAGRDTTRRT